LDFQYWFGFRDDLYRQPQNQRMTPKHAAPDCGKIFAPLARGHATRKQVFGTL